MIHLNSKNIDASSNAHLEKVQKEITDEPTFEEQAKKASAKWDSKTSGAGKSAFKNIKDTLMDMCVSVEICVYCEQNEATDIEHIYPKKLYPEKSFTWENYVLACGKCNTHHKSDKFKIFKPHNSAIEEDVTPPRGVYIQPANDDSLFINQRKENPMALLELDLVNKQFVFIEKFPEGTREYKKAKYTKDLLGLNTRAALVASRKAAAKFYLSRFEKYVGAKNAIDFQQLSDALNDDLGDIDQTQDFDIEKARILESIKTDVLSYSHPTVMKELISQRDSLPKTNSLLNKAPEITTW